MGGRVAQPRSVPVFGPSSGTDPRFSKRAGVSRRYSPPIFELGDTPLRRLLYIARLSGAHRQVPVGHSVQRTLQEQEDVAHPQK